MDAWVAGAVMIGPLDVICLSSDPWGPLARRRRHLMDALVRRGHARRVLFVEPGTRLTELLAGPAPASALRDAARAALNVRPVAPSIGAVTPCLPLPLARYHAVRALNVSCNVPLLRRAARRLGIRAPVLWISNPVFSPYIAHLGARLLVFDRTDAWALMPDTAARVTAAQEDALARRADLVFAVSEALRAGAARHNEHVYLLPNAVDPAHYAGVAPDAGPARGGEGAARVGYVGSIWQQRLDVDLVRAVAALRPRYAFDFVGPAHPTFRAEWFAATPNVHFLGERPYEALPAFLATCDAAWIPHRVDALTESMNPLKLWEYAAAGLPIVATPVAGVDAAGDLALVGTSPEAVAAALDRAIGTDTRELRARRRAFAGQHSWDARADAAALHIRAALGRVVA